LWLKRDMFLFAIQRRMQAASFGENFFDILPIVRTIRGRLFGRTQGPIHLGGGGGENTTKLQNQPLVSTKSLPGVSARHRGTAQTKQDMVTTESNSWKEGGE
jgi:hypothetical protein